ncbi:MAG: hypothetical protein V4465_02270 [Patescibacteria group bacterium]
MNKKSERGQENSRDWCLAAVFGAIFGWIGLTYETGPGILLSLFACYCLGKALIAHRNNQFNAAERQEHYDRQPRFRQKAPTP